MTTPPPWLTRIRPALDSAVPQWFSTFVPPPNPKRQSAVLMLFGPRGDVSREAADGIDVVLTERAADMRNHAAQVSFPGGHLDPTDDHLVAAAVREAEEEVGIVPASVDVIDTLPPLYMHPSQNAVTPVLAWWRDPHPIRVIDTREVARVVRTDVDHLLNPANRFTAIAGPYRSPAWSVDGLIIWGFTANLLDHVFDLAGMTRPWDTADERELPDYLLRPYTEIRRQARRAD